MAVRVRRPRVLPLAEGLAHVLLLAQLCLAQQVDALLRATLLVRALQRELRLDALPLPRDLGQLVLLDALRPLQLLLQQLLVLRAGDDLLLLLLHLRLHLLLLLRNLFLLPEEGAEAGGVARGAQHRWARQQTRQARAPARPAVVLLLLPVEDILDLLLDLAAQRHHLLGALLGARKDEHVLVRDLPVHLDHLRGPSSLLPCLRCGKQRRGNNDRSPSPRRERQEDAEDVPSEKLAHLGHGRLALEPHA